MQKNNFSIQKSLYTYKKASDLEESLFWLNKTDLSPSTKKFLSYFRHTLGATQAKIETICAKVGISDRTYRRTVRTELRSFFGQSIIFFDKSQQKKSNDGSKKVKASEFKVLAPLSIIKNLVNKYFEQRDQEAQEMIAAAFPVEEAAAPLSGDVSGVVSGESQAETPCKSKDEPTFSGEQKKALSKNLLKDPNKLFNITGGFYKIKKSIQDYIFHFPVFRDWIAWSESKRYEICERFAACRHKGQG